MPIGDAILYERLRRDVGTTVTVLDDTDAELFFVEANEKYPNSAAKRTAYTRVLVIRALLAPSALQGKYVQNQSSEDLTKVFDNLLRLLRLWEDEVALAADVAIGAASAFFFVTAPGRRGV